MRAAAWAGGDAAWTAASVALAPRVLLGHAVEENPVEYLEVAVFLVTLTRACWFYGLWPRHAGYAKSGETARTFIVQTIATQVAGTCILHAVLVLFGAPFVQMAGRTFLCAALLANLAVTPFAWISTRSSDASAMGHEFADFFFNLQSETAVDRILLAQAFGTLAGAWLGALPIPLDWDRPWQAWPATIVYGAFAGFCLGSGVGVFLGTAMFPAASKKQR